MVPESGYTALASFLSSFPDALALKRFRELQIKNLLYYQAELAHLEMELGELEQEDASLTTSVSQRASSRWTPSMAQETPPPTTDTTRTLSSLYAEKMLQIRRTLRSYSKSLAAICHRHLTCALDSAVEQYRRLDTIPCPQKSDLKAVCDWLDGMHKGAAFLSGDIEDVWHVKLNTGELRPTDAVDFYGFVENNSLAYGIGTSSAFLQRLFFQGGQLDRPHHIDTSTSGPVGKVISTMIASVLPMLPIVIFYFVQRPLVRIGLILIFTAVSAAVCVMALQLKPETTLAITTA